MIDDTPYREMQLQGDYLLHQHAYQREYFPAARW
jgi:hypothetical protein